MTGIGVAIDGSYDYRLVALSVLIAALASYADAYDTGPVPNETAKQLIDQYLAIEQDEAKMNRSYVPRLAEALPGAKVARYIQVETKIRAVVRYDLAARIPLVQ